MSIERWRRGERDFRWRGGSVSRIEGLSDCVFALAMTLIVVSLQVPRSYAELVEAFVQAPVFAVCFAFFLWTWSMHFRFHRRFGLEDRGTLVLDALLLFLVLLYVYPLRAMASFLYDALVLGRGGDAAFLHDRHEAQVLMLVYSGGFVLLSSVFASMYARAWSKRIEMELDSVERVLTKSELHAHLLSAAVGLSSFALAAFDARFVAPAGWIYFLLAPLRALHGWSTGRAVERYRGKIPDVPRPS
jgi:uncharacterized membrane protein